MPCPDVFIKDYYLSLSPRLRVPVPPSCVHRDSTLPFFFNYVYTIVKKRNIVTIVKPWVPQNSHDCATKPVVKTSSALLHILAFLNFKKVPYPQTLENMYRKPGPTLY